MPRKKKKAEEMTDEEVLRRVFPKPVVEELKRQVKGPTPDSESPTTDKDTD